MDIKLASIDTFALVVTFDVKAPRIVELAKRVDTLEELEELLRKEN